MNDSDHQPHDSDRLVRQGKQYRYVRQERCDAQRRLQQEHTGERDRAGTAGAVVRAVGGMQYRKRDQQIGDHPVHELHREVIIDEIQPGRMEQQQVLAIARGALPVAELAGGHVS